jgi:DNA-binding CsgD family transcriptional regulator
VHRPVRRYRSPPVSERRHPSAEPVLELPVEGVPHVGLRLGEVDGLFRVRREVVELDGRTEERPRIVARRELDAHGLTPREGEVLAWVAEGKTNPEIGAILGLSPRTVGNHLARIYDRLGVETRTAAARIALTAH